MRISLNWSVYTIINSLGEPIEYKAGVGVGEPLHSVGPLEVGQEEDVVLLDQHQPLPGPLGVLELLYLVPRETDRQLERRCRVSAVGALLIEKIFCVNNIASSLHRPLSAGH